jgi:hypothetical protein
MNVALIISYVGVVLAVFGIGVTVFVARLVDKRTTRLLRRIESMQIVEMPPEKYNAVLRAMEDMERTGDKAVTVRKNQNGKWILEFDAEVMDGVNMGDRPNIKEQKK